MRMTEEEAKALLSRWLLEGFKRRGHAPHDPLEDTPEERVAVREDVLAWLIRFDPEVV